ncbi:conserved hypothetical protein [Candidatus Desulfarcum epimagneticum]|uniref:Thioesterase family protein n=1 Tax=uncultured Desulfobacteraceae bacterium TaxID=218296 RepID=A0A484HH21_9BACT|nr:conserved hypothetical protein [uncultured Desulfobacteraceae bacterium]
MSAPASRFDEDIFFEPVGDGLFRGRVSENWSINQTPDGGYIMAILANAILGLSEKKTLSILTANFISRCGPGEAEVAVEKIGATRSFERWMASLSMGGKRKVQALATLSDLDSGERRYESSPPDMPPPGECVAIREIPDFTLFQNVDMRLDPDCAGWMWGKLSDQCEQRGWIRFIDNRPLDPLSLLLMADSFPPPVMAKYGMVAWVPTLELSVNIRNIPKTRWLKCVFRSRFNDSGLVDEDGELWDEEGRLAAISRQISQFRKKQRDSR